MLVMLAIIAHHYVINSGLTAADGPLVQNPVSGATIFLLLFASMGKTGINCFVLITGYYMCKTSISLRKFAKLLLVVIFYRVAIYLVFWLTGYEPFDIVDFLLALCPVTKIERNFTATYLLFFLCIPFLSRLVHSLTELEHIKLLAVSGLIYIFFGTIPLFPMEMNYISWYIVLFFIASYLRLYPKKLFSNTKFWGWMSALSLGLSLLSVVVCAFLGAALGLRIPYIFVTDSNTFLAVLTGVCTFMFFKNLNIKYSPFINALGASCFGVLLIHANSGTMRRWLWVDLLNNMEAYYSPWLPLHAIGSVLVIFAVCAALDSFRRKALEEPFFRLWDRKLADVDQRIDSRLKALCDKYGISYN